MCSLLFVAPAEYALLPGPPPACQLHAVGPVCLGSHQCTNLPSSDRPARWRSSCQGCVAAWVATDDPKGTSAQRRAAEAASHTLFSSKHKSLQTAPGSSGGLLRGRRLAAAGRGRGLVVGVLQKILRKFDGGSADPAPRNSGGAKQQTHFPAQRLTSTSTSSRIVAPPSTSHGQGGQGKSR